jgi:bifunctional DNA-binding transcriptional regulator/antitoxin component of YhaV-PrlF toxin-antitoxin module
MTEHNRDPDVDRFNESASRALNRPPMGRRRPPEPLEPGVAFKVYRVSRAGQLTLPGTARSSWGIREGGEVHVAHTGDFVIIVRAGAWSRVLSEWNLDADLARELQQGLRSDSGGPTGDH